MKKIIFTLVTLGYFLGNTAVYANITNEHITTMFHQTLAEKQSERIGRISYLFNELGIIQDAYTVAIALGDNSNAEDFKKTFARGVDEVVYLISYIGNTSQFKPYLLMKLDMVIRQLNEMQNSDTEEIVSGINLNTFLPLSWGWK